MKEIHFYFDVISPYAWLAFQALPKALAGISHRVHYHPVVFGAMLKHHGQLGPAEMPGKRDWTYRQVMWLAKQQGTDLQMPASHPFNSLVLLRLAVAASDNGQPNLVQISEAAFAGAFNGMNHTHRHTRRWHIRIVAGQDLFGTVLQTRKETHGLVLDALQPHYPKRLLSVAVAASDNGQPNRYVVESIFKHVWCTGLEASDAERYAALQLHLLSQATSSSKDPQSVEVKQLLQQQTQEAIDLGLFGVPSMVVNGQVFWGQDALPMLRAYLQGDAWFESADWQDAGKLPVGIRRTPASK